MRPSEPEACGQRGERKASRDDEGFLPCGHSSITFQKLVL